MRKSLAVAAGAAVLALGGYVALVGAPAGAVVPNDAAHRPVLSRPPVFVEYGKAQPLTAVVLSAPDAVRVEVDNGLNVVRHAMAQVDNGSWVGELSATDTLSPVISMRLVAVYGTTSIASNPYTMFVPQQRKTMIATPLDLTRSTVVSLPWGTGTSEFGRTGGDEAATTVPSSVVTSPDGTVSVLDTANARVLTFDLTGAIVSRTPLPSSTVDYLLSDPATGNLVAIDAVNFVAYTLQNGTLSAIQQLNLGSYVNEVRGFYMGGIGSVVSSLYAIVGSQNEAIPVIIDGVVTTAQQQDIGREFGIPAAGGHLLIEKSDNAIQFGLVSASGGLGATPVGTAISIPFAETILEVSPVDLNKAHKLAFLVTTLTGDGLVKDNLVRVNVGTGEATVSDITVTVPGDMTQRVAPLDTNIGVVLFTGDATGGQLTIFNGQEG